MQSQQNLPSDIDAERAVLGAILIRDKALPLVRSVLSAEDFYVPAHRGIFWAMCKLEAQGKPIDPQTVASQLGEHLAKVEGGQGYLIGLLDAVPLADNAPTYAESVAEAAARRALISLVTEIRGKALSGDADAKGLLAEMQTRASAIARQGARAKSESLASVTLRTIEALQRTRGGLSGIATGLSDLDGHIGGLREKELYLIAGRPGMGKTALSWTIAKGVAQQGIPVLFFSLEMPNQQLVERMLAELGRVDLADVRRGCENNPAGWREILTRAPRMAESTKAWLCEMTGPTLAEVRSEAVSWASEHVKGKGLVVVDYVQLMTGSSRRDSRQQQIGECSRGLKNLAKELSVPVIELAQLNRDCEKREDKRPVLSDLREAGDLEQDADAVMFVYRDEVYDEGTPDKGIAELIFGKHRNGPTGTVRLGFEGKHTRFFNLAPA